MVTSHTDMLLSIIVHTILSVYYISPPYCQCIISPHHTVSVLYHGPYDHGTPCVPGRARSREGEGGEGEGQG